MTFGERLRLWREARGYSQKRAAEAAGISQGSWSEYENDSKLPRVAQAIALARLTAGDPNAVTLEMVSDAEKQRDAEIADRREAQQQSAATGTDDRTPHRG